MTDQEYILQTAKELYMKLPIWKRWQFMKWKESNNWDVKRVYERCVTEAKYLCEENKLYSHVADGIIQDIG